MDAIDLDKDNWEINALFYPVMLQLILDFYLFVWIFAKIDNLFVWIFSFFGDLFVWIISIYYFCTLK